MPESGEASAAGEGPDDPAGEAEGDDATDERRLFEQTTAASHLYVACDIGVARVAIARDRIGQFELVARCSPTSIATSAGRVAVGTAERVLLSVDGETFAPAGGETALVTEVTRGTDTSVAAVGLDGSHLLDATDDGRVFGRGSDAEASDWQRLGRVGDPRRFDGPLLAAGDGIYRVDVDESTVESLGLTDGRDVAAVPTTGEWTDTGDCFAATADGLLRYRDGEWTDERSGSTRGVEATRDGVYAVDESGLLERDRGDWRRLDSPAGVPADIAHGESLYCVTGDGTVHIAVGAGLASDGHRGWRSQPLGLDGVVGVALV